MAIQATQGGMFLPHMFPVGAVPSFSALTLAASTDKVAVVFRVPRTGTLDKFEWMAGAVSINSGSAVRCSFQDPSTANGDPDGTQDQFRDMAGTAVTANTWMVPGLITSDGTDGGSKRSVTRGDRLCAVLEYQTFTAADSVAVNTISSFPTIVGFPYPDRQTGGTWTKSSNYPVIALKYNDGTYEYIAANVWPVEGSTAFPALSLNTGSTPDEAGNIFQLPFPCRATGAWVMTNPGAAGRDFDLVLYDSDGSTPLQTTSVDTDVLRTATAPSTVLMHFPTTSALSANTNYRIVFKPTTASNTSTYECVVNAAAIMAALPGGSNWHKTTRSDAGAWTQDTTNRVMIGLLLDGFDDAAAGSGGGIRLAGHGGLAA